MGAKNAMGSGTAVGGGTVAVSDMQLVSISILSEDHPQKNAWTPQERPERPCAHIHAPLVHHMCPSSPHAPLINQHPHAPEQKPYHRPLYKPPVLQAAAQHAEQNHHTWRGKWNYRNRNHRELHTKKPMVTTIQQYGARKGVQPDSEFPWKWVGASKVPMKLAG